MLKSAKESGSGKTYRSRSKTVVAIIFGFIGLGIGVGTGIEKVSDNILGVALGGLFAALSLTLAARVAWSAVFVREREIHVANVFSSFDLQWSDIDRFDIGRWKLFPYVCLIHTRDGTVRPATGIEEKSQFPTGAAKHMVNELNRELASKLIERQTGFPGVGSAQDELFRNS